MKKIINIVAGLFFLHVVSCWPLLARYYYEPLTQWCLDVRVCMIVNYILAITLVSIFFSLLAMVFKAYRTALFFALIPFFVQAVVMCSALLVFLFHRELTAAMAVSRLRAVSDAIMYVLKTPVNLAKRLFSH